MPSIWLIIFLLIPGLSVAQPSVVSTTSLVHDLVKKIGGDKVNAQGLMAPDIDPHYYRASFGDMRKLARADLVFYNGLGLEGRMEEVLKNLSAIAPTYPLSDFIEPNLLISENAIPDPHFWMDVRLWQQAAKGVAETLSHYWPEHQDSFNQHLKEYLTELDALHDWIQQQVQTLPEKQRLLITAHDAFGYYGAAYGIEVIGLQGINTTSEVGLKDLRMMKDLIKQRSVKAVFVEASVPDRTIKSLIAGVKAEGGELALGGKLYSDALAAEHSEAGNYIGMMRQNTQTIVKALQ
ncbi:zinc ABC transporter substrate-binding protein [Thiomicrospira microaerophila]|uniref:metal ABC transporter solute-binding protein, Zn/Mn family n=1 Tax=Thiomicrospira microaerophila TaxID=406020 RepID=UPI00200DF672|nr:zinc ABC transporter substrate-binding protein [Thiomicrospira microaerophila]UQB41290.1 zinc ABC transporter substrate-binding protein [Thiomicrospira microaerophila]